MCGRDDFGRQRESHFFDAMCIKGIVQLKMLILSFTHTYVIPNLNKSAEKYNDNEMLHV